MSPRDGPWERGEPEWPVRDRVVAWETEYFQAGYDTVERPDGETEDYYWLDPGDAVAVVAVADDGVLTVEQYRPRIQMRTVDLPGGAVDDGEGADEAARRELREETGYAAERVTYVDTYVPTGWTRYVCHVFVAEGLSPGEQDLDAGEFVDVEAIPVDEFVGAVHAREQPVTGAVLTPFLLAREADLV